MVTSTVTVANGDVRFEVPDGEIILDAALKQGIALPHQCRGASCGTCKSRVLEGAVDHGWSFGFAIDDVEKAAGLCLLCQSRATTPTLVIETLQPMPTRGIPVRTIDTVVVAVTDESPRVRRIVLRPAADAAFVYPAGSYAELVLPGIAANRMYSFVNACAASAPAGLLEFYIARHPSGVASGYVHASLRVGDDVRIAGPFGTCRLPDGDGPVLALAGGTGIAPLLAILEDGFHDRPTLDAHLLFSVRTNDDLFALDRLHAMALRHPSFRFDVSVTAEPPRTTVARHGELLTTLVPRLHPDLSAHRVVIGGSPGLVDACVAMVARLGAATDAIAFDRFTPLVSTHAAADTAVAA